MKHFIKMLLIGIVLMLSGCSPKDSEKTNQSPYSNDMLVLIEISYISPRINSHAILVDRETRVMYMENTGGYSSTPVVMLNPDGTPRIYEGDLN